MNDAELMKQRMRTLLWDTVDYYETTKAFGFNVQLDVCDYYDPQTGAKCAVGRVMKNPENFVELEFSIPAQDRNLDDEEKATLDRILSDIVDDYKNLPRDFLMLLQVLHDAWVESRSLDEDGNYLTDYHFPVRDYQQIINYIEGYR